MRGKNGRKVKIFLHGNTHVNQNLGGCFAKYISFGKVATEATPPFTLFPKNGYESRFVLESYLF